MSDEMDDLDLQKRKLEIEKLKKEINTEHFFPSKKLAVWQAIAPPLLTVISILITSLILLNLNVFDINNKLLAIQKDSLNFQKNDLRNQIDGFTHERDSLKSANDNLKTNSINLLNKLHTDSAILKRTAGSMTECQKELSKSINDKNVLEGAYMRVRDRAMGLGIAEQSHSMERERLLQENNKKSEKISAMRGQIHNFSIVLNDFAGELKKDPESASSEIGWVTQELKLTMIAFDKDEP